MKIYQCTRQYPLLIETFADDNDDYGGGDDCDDDDDEGDDNAIDDDEDLSVHTSISIIDCEAIDVHSDGDGNDDDDYDDYSQK